MLNKNILFKTSITHLVSYVLLEELSFYNVKFVKLRNWGVKNVQSYKKKSVNNVKVMNENDNKLYTL